MTNENRCWVKGCIEKRVSEHWCKKHDKMTANDFVRLGIRDIW